MIPNVDPGWLVFATWEFGKRIKQEAKRHTYAVPRTIASERKGLKSGSREAEDQYREGKVTTPGSKISLPEPSPRLERWSNTLMMCYNDHGIDRSHPAVILLSELETEDAPMNDADPASDVRLLRLLVCLNNRWIMMDQTSQTLWIQQRETTDDFFRLKIWDESRFKSILRFLISEGRRVTRSKSAMRVVAYSCLLVILHNS